jgi:phosphoglucosamine mutase
MTRKFFGTDGVRGHVGEEPITPEFVMKLGYAAGKVFGNQAQGRPGVLIGKDTRISGYMLEAALEAGFAAAGVDTYLTGPLPTPAVAYLTRALRLSAGVVISASHNPYPDNGIKFFDASGNKLPDEVEERIELELIKPMGCVKSEQLGRARRLEDSAGRYIEFCKSSFPNSYDLRGLKVVVDCANGAAYQTGPAVFHELGADVVTIGASPNGVNINEGFGATHPEALQKAVKDHDAHLGIALDGDADRLLMVDRSGRLFNGDELLYVMVKDRAFNEHVQGVVGTLMSNLALEQAFDRMGVAFARAKVGDRYVLELLQQKGWLYGGESSGHILALDCHTTGDGTISALQMLAAVKRSGKSLAELCSDLKMFPQKLINVKIPKGFDWKQHQPLQLAQNKVEQALGRDGRVLIRASGTEPLLRLMVEARNEQVANGAAQELANSLQDAAMVA